MLKQTIRSASHLRDKFQQYDRADQFSYCAFDTLFEWYSDLGSSRAMQFDVIGICCDWCEYDSVSDLAGDYSIALEDLVDPTDIPDMDEDEIEEAYAEAMNNRGVLLRVEGGSVLFSE